MHIKSLTVSNSSLSLLHSCARKLEFRKFFMHPGGNRSVAGDAGSALHAGYQHYLMHGDRDAALVEMALEYPIDLLDNPMKELSLEYCIPTLDAMIDSEALLEYELASVACIDGVERPAVEVFFQINLTNFSLSDDEHVPVAYNGFIDAILYNHLSDEYVVVDIKTHRNNKNDLTPKYQYAPQCLPYGIVLERMLGRPIEDLTIKYMSVYIDIFEPRVGLYTFEKTQQDIHDWARTLLLDVQQIKLYYKLQWFPRIAFNGCVAWFRTCEFFDVCASRDDKVIQDMILSNKKPYTTRSDTPWIECDLDLGIINA